MLHCQDNPADSKQIFNWDTLLLLHPTLVISLQQNIICHIKLMALI